MYRRRRKRQKSRRIEQLPVRRQLRKDRPRDGLTVRNGQIAVTEAAAASVLNAVQTDAAILEASVRRKAVRIDFREETETEIVAVTTASREETATAAAIEIVAVIIVSREETETEIVAVTAVSREETETETVSKEETETEIVAVTEIVSREETETKIVSREETVIATVGRDAGPVREETVGETIKEAEIPVFRLRL